MPIVIVDDRSNQKFLTEVEPSIPNLRVISSKDTPFEGAGEMLGYFMLQQQRLFEKAVVIHDSVFIQKPVDFTEVQMVKPLWVAGHGHDVHYKKEIGGLIASLHASKRQPMEARMWVASKFEGRFKWWTMFGMMAAIDLSFLDQLVTKYHLWNTLPQLKGNRQARMGMERVFGLICHLEVRDATGDELPLESHFGSIVAHQGIGRPGDGWVEKEKSWQDFQKALASPEASGRFSLPDVVKVWTGR